MTGRVRSTWRRVFDEDITRGWLVRTTFAILLSWALFAGLVIALLSWTSDDDAQVIGGARLTWDPGVDDALGEGKAASVEIIEEDGAYRAYVFDIEVLRPPTEFEFIEAWLVDDDADPTERLSMGTFDEIRTRLFPLPGVIDPRVYDRVEFSLEPDDENESYSGRTLVRGTLIWLTAPPS